MSETNFDPSLNLPNIQQELPSVPSQLINGGTADKPSGEPTLNTQVDTTVIQEIEDTKEFKTDLEFVQYLKLQALGEHPTPGEEEIFENSMQGLSINILERFFKLQEAKVPFQFVGNDSGDVRYQRTGLFVGGQYKINADLKGSELKGLNEPHISLQAPMNGGDDSLIKGLWGVDIGIKTGEIKSGKNEVTPTQKATIEAVLRTTQAYYAEVEKAIPLAESIQKAGGYAQNFAPPFPQDALIQLRRLPK